MKKRGYIAMLTVIICLMISAMVFSGCAGGAAMRDTASGLHQDSLQAEIMPMSAPQMEDMAYDEESEDYFGYEKIANHTTAAASDPPAQNPKRIYQADMSIRVEHDDVAGAAERIVAECERMGGYVESQYIQTNNNTASLTLRISSDDIQTLRTAIANMGKELSFSMSMDDVTREYYDIELRLEHARKEEAELKRIMEDCETIEDLMNVRGYLSAVQMDIESYEGQLRYLDARAGYSYFSLQILPPVTPAPVEPDEPIGMFTWEGLWDSVVRGFDNSLRFVVNIFAYLLIFFSYALIPLLVAAVVLGVVLMLVRLHKRRKQQLSQNIIPGDQIQRMMEQPSRDAPWQDPETKN